jgi:hypothetical protein
MNTVYLPVNIKYSAMTITGTQIEISVNDPIIII